MPRMAQFQWLLRCAGAAAAVLLACKIATTWLAGSLQQPATTTRDGSTVTFNRYLIEKTPDVVLVGSSITWRLKEEYFSTPRVRNLALAGGSPVTGLTIIAKQPILPKVILVETNVLSRPVDTELIDRFSRGDYGPYFFRPVRAAVAAYENWNHPPLDNEHAVAAREELLKQPPSNFDNHIYVDRAVQQMNEQDPSADVLNSVEQLKKLIAAVEHRGCRVFLIEIPLSPPIGDSRYAKITKELVHEAFPDPERWLQIDAPGTELRWADGVHLDERSALIVVQLIERALAGAGKPTRALLDLPR